MESKEFEEHMLQLDRVTRVVKGGRRMRFRATVVIGDKAGRVGLGLGKGQDVQIAIQKAVASAKKGIVSIPLVRGTITHEMVFKFKSAKIFVKPASAGTGIKAGGAMRKILEMAGVTDIIGKSFGTNNRVVVAQAAMALLKELTPTKESEQFVAELKKARKAEKAAEAAAKEETRSAGRRGPRRQAPESSAPKKPANDSGEGRLAEEAKR